MCIIIVVLEVKLRWKMSFYFLIQYDFSTILVFCAFTVYVVICTTIETVTLKTLFERNTAIKI